MDWLDRMYELVAVGKIDDALDVAFNNFDDLFLAGKFDEADRAIEMLDVNRLDEALCCGVLACTLPARPKLTKRPALVYRVRARLMEIAPKRIEGLMRGLDHNEGPKKMATIWSKLLGERDKK